MQALFETPGSSNDQPMVSQQEYDFRISQALSRFIREKNQASVTSIFNDYIKPRSQAGDVNLSILQRVANFARENHHVDLLQAVLALNLLPPPVLWEPEEERYFLQEMLTASCVPPPFNGYFSTKNMTCLSAPNSPGVAFAHGVYLSQDETVFKRILAKNLQPRLFHGKRAIDKAIKRVTNFGREVEILNFLQGAGRHPNLVHLTDLFYAYEQCNCGTCGPEIQLFIYLGMSYAPGKTLYHMTKQDFEHMFKPGDEGFIERQKCSILIVYQIAKALKHLHSVSRAYRDLKLENIMVDMVEAPDGDGLRRLPIIKVIDLGYVATFPRQHPVRERTPDSRGGSGCPTFRPPYGLVVDLDDSIIPLQDGLILTPAYRDKLPDGNPGPPCLFRDQFFGQDIWGLGMLLFTSVFGIPPMGVNGCRAEAEAAIDKGANPDILLVLIARRILSYNISIPCHMLTRNPKINPEVFNLIKYLLWHSHPTPVEKIKIGEYGKDAYPPMLFHRDKIPTANDIIRYIENMDLVKTELKQLCMYYARKRASEPESAASSLRP